jgi:hypothetical protein
MSDRTTQYQKELANEIREMPIEYLPNLLKIVRLFRESVALKPAAASLRQGLEEAMTGEVRPIANLWDGIEK